MKLNNRKRATKLKRIFFITSIILALVSLGLFLLNYTFSALATVGVFSLWFLYFFVADYLYIEFSDENDKVILRYYKAVRFGKPAYRSIDFPQYMLRKVYFENSMFGKMSDITFIVKTEKGIAEYESVSLSAVLLPDRIKMQDALHDIIEK